MSKFVFDIEQEIKIDISTMMPREIHDLLSKASAAGWALSGTGYRVDRAELCFSPIVQQIGPDGKVRAINATPWPFPNLVVSKPQGK